MMRFHAMEISRSRGRLLRTLIAAYALVQVLSGHAAFGQCVRGEGDAVAYQGVRSLAYSPNGLSILSASGDTCAQLWDVQSGNLIGTLFGHTGTVSSVAFSPDGNMALTGSDDNTARLWDVKSRKEIRHFAGVVKCTVVEPFGNANPQDCSPPRIKAVAFSPDGRTVCTVGNRGVIQIWQTSTGKEIRRLQHNYVQVGNPISTTIEGLAYSPDGRYVVAEGEGTVRVWEVRTGREVRQTSDDRGIWGIGFSISFSPSSTLLLVSGDAHSVFTDSVVPAAFWDVATGRKTPTQLPSFFSAAFSPDGKSALTVHAAHVAVLWNVDTGKEVRRLEGHSIYFVAFAPDGRTALTGGDYETGPVLWDVATGKVIRTFGGHPSVGDTDFPGRSAR